MTLDFKSAAVLVWMPAGSTPSIEAYQGEDGTAPETVGYWELGVALVIATKGPRLPGKEAWIKVGAVVLGPDQLERAYEAMKNGQNFSA